MNANNVYIGVTLDNEEILLYRESSDKFINLITKEYVSLSDIQADKLIHYTMLKDNKHQLKGTIIRTFEKDRSEKLDVRNIFIGDIVQTTECKFDDVCNLSLPILYWKVTYDIKCVLVKKDALLYRLNEGYNIATLDDDKLFSSEFIDLETELKYCNTNYDKVGSLFVDTKMKPYLSVVEYNEPIEEKRMVLKKYRERRGK